MQIWVLALFGLLLPPLAVFLDKGANQDFVINIIVTVFLVLVGGVIHAFHVMGVGLVTNIFCLLVPPIGVLIDFGCTGTFWITLLLTLLGDFPGIFYAYYSCLWLAKGGDGPKPPQLA